MVPEQVAKSRSMGRNGSLGTQQLEHGTRPVQKAYQLGAGWQQALTLQVGWSWAWVSDLRLCDKLVSKQWIPFLKVCLTLNVPQGGRGGSWMSHAKEPP